VSEFSPPLPLLLLLFCLLPLPAVTKCPTFGVFESGILDVSKEGGMQANAEMSVYSYAHS